MLRSSACRPSLFCFWEQLRSRWPLRGVLFGKILSVISKGKINPLIGAAGVSAVPMSARVVQLVGQEEDRTNFLLMHAMGPNVAGVIGSAIAAGVLLSVLG